MATCPDDCEEMKATLTALGAQKIGSVWKIRYYQADTEVWLEAAEFRTLLDAQGGEVREIF